jgi:hypothetical protein
MVFMVERLEAGGDRSSSVLGDVNRPALWLLGV